MTSQISILKLLKQEIRQNGWMFGLTALGHFLTGPVVFLLNTSRHSNWTVLNAEHRYHDYFTDVYFLWQLFTMIACICIGIFIYRYLFSRRMVDLYHSVPITRSKLFLVKYLHGFLIWFIPFAVSGISTLLLFAMRAWGAPYFAATVGTYFKTTLLLLLCFFIFYHLFLTAVFLSGNVINMFANTGIIGCSVLGLWTVGHSCAGNYFDTYAYTPPSLVYDVIYSFSPFAAPFAMCNYLSSDDLYAKHMPLVLLSILISLGLLELAWILYLRRPSELAENGTITKTYIIPARVIVSILAGIAGALFFSAISSREDQLGWGIFGALLCSVVCFGAINSIFRVTIKAFFKHRLQIILSAIVSTMIVLVFQLDIFGYDTYLPKKDDIAGVAIYTHQLSDDSSYLKEGLVTTYGTNITWERSYNVAQQDLLTDPVLCYDLLESFVHTEAEGSYTTYYTKVKLKNGRIYERRYQLSDSIYDKVVPFIESDAYKETNYKFSIGTFGYPSELTVDLWDARFDASPEEIEQIMDAYWADFEEHYTLDELSSYMSVFDLSGQYGGDSEISNTRYFWLDVHSNYERTIDVLETLYPEHKTAVTTADDIKELRIYADLYKTSESDEGSIESLYEYFGYPTADTAPEEEDPKNESEVVISSNSTGQPQTLAMPIEAVCEITITDPQMLKEIYPLLSFGNYSDMYGRKEYIYLGDIITAKHSNINCYIKPGTLPEEIIHMLYDAREEYK